MSSVESKTASSSASRRALKPGEWACVDAKCAHINAEFRNTCDSCGKMKPRAKNRIGREIGKDAAEKSKGLFAAEDWACTKCGNINWARRTTCNICNAPKLGDLEVRTGYGGGYMDREDVEYIERRDEDEFDEFGRKKKRRADEEDQEDDDGHYVLTERLKPEVDAQRFGHVQEEKTAIIEEEEEEDRVQDEEDEEDEEDDDDGLDKYDLTADPELATKTLIIRRKDGDRAGSPSADRTSSRASSDCSCSCSGGECSCEESDDDKRNSFSSQRNRNQQQRRGGHEDIRSGDRSFERRRNRSRSPRDRLSPRRASNRGDRR